MRNYLFIVLFIMGPLFAEQSIPPEKLHAIRELINITGARMDREAIAQTFIQQMLSVLRAHNPDLPEKAIDIVTEQVYAIVAEEVGKESLQQHIYPIYAKYFTLAELKGLIEFNRSATGRKANKVMPKLIQESMDAAQNWSRQLGPGLSQRVLKRFAAEGIEIDQ